MDIKRIVLLIALIFLLTPQLLTVGDAAAQCYSPTGFFASEVLLSKPGVTYDLEPIKKAANVTVVRSSILYRSHYDDRVAVILTPMELFEEKGLDVRLQLPTRKITISTTYLELVANESIRVADLDLMKGKDTEWVLDLDYRPTVEGPPLQVSNLTKSNLKITFIPLTNETLPGTFIRIEVTNTTSLSDQNRLDLVKIFDAIGFPKSYDALTKGLEFKRASRSVEDLESALDMKPHEFKWDEAIKIELKWLISNRVIRGLVDNDLETLAALAPYAWGEHNFKARYYKDKWVLGVTEEMLNENYTREYQGLANCEGFSSTYLPESPLSDFNTGSQPLEVVAEQSVAGAGIRVAIIGGVLVALSAVYLRRRRNRRKRIQAD